MFQVMSKNNEQSGNGTSTPSAPEVKAEAPVVNENGLTISQFPRIQDAKSAVVVRYGEEEEVLPVAGGFVSIDRYFFSSPTNMSLKHIRIALKGLKDQGHRMPDGKEIDAAWFNTNVRDPFHKSLKFAAQFSIDHGTPKSCGFTRRKLKDGSIIVTANHKFEHVQQLPPAQQIAADAAAVTEAIKAGVVKALADQAAANEKAAKDQSKTRAARQPRKPKKEKTLTPLVSKPEDIARLDAIAAAAAAVPPTPEATPAAAA